MLFTLDLFQKLSDKYHKNQNSQLTTTVWICTLSLIRYLCFQTNKIGQNNKYLNFYNIIFHFQSFLDPRQLMIAARFTVATAHAQWTKMPTHFGFHCAAQKSQNLNKVYNFWDNTFFYIEFIICWHEFKMESLYIYI